MIKIIYYNPEIDKQIKKIDLGKKFDFDYSGQPEVNIDKAKPSFFSNLFSKRAPVGAPIPEGLIPIIIDGLTIIRDTSWELTKGILIHEIIKFYEVAQTKKEVPTEDKLITADKLIKEDKIILQIITDQHIGEVGDLRPNEKSISFAFIEGLTKEQINKAYSEIDKIRSKIKELLEIVVLKNVDRIECVYKKDKWDVDGWNIEFVSYHKRDDKYGGS